MDKWISLLAVIVPTALGALGVLATDGLEHARMKNCLDIYDNALDARTRKYLAEAVRAEAWKSTQPILFRHPTMNGAIYLMLAVAYGCIAGYVRVSGKVPNKKGGTDISSTVWAETAFFAIICVVLLAGAVIAFNKRVIPVSGGGDFCEFEYLDAVMLQSIDKEKLDWMRDQQIRDIAVDLHNKSLIDQELSRRL